MLGDHKPGDHMSGDHRSTARYLFAIFVGVCILLVRCGRRGIDFGEQLEVHEREIT